MWKKNRWMRPERVMALGFLALILLGGVLLSLPCAAQNGRSIGLGNGLFTATSAVCVTGLVAVDTGTTFSLFGQITLLALIQIGGLGFMAFATLTMVLLGRKIGLRDRMLLRESMNTSGLSGLVRLTRWYLTAALVIVENPKNLKIVELEAPQLPRSLDDAQIALAVINTTYASQIGLTPAKDGIFVEGKESPYVNLIVAREDNKDAENVKKFVQAYQSDEVYEAANKIFNGGAVKGW